jgi:hypothetical protein
MSDKNSSGSRNWDSLDTLVFFAGGKPHTKARKYVEDRGGRAGSGSGNWSSGSSTWSGTTLVDGPSGDGSKSYYGSGEEPKSYYGSGEESK